MKKFKNEETEKVNEDEECKNILIGLTGAEHRAGVTHLSFSIGNYLAGQGYQVAILEMNDSGAFEKLREMYNPVIDGKKYIIGSAEYYMDADPAELDEILDQKLYDFIILDMGVYSEFDVDLFQRCDQKFIVSGGKPWEFHHLTEIFEETDMDELQKYSFIFTFTPESIKENVLEGMGQLEKIFFIEYIEDPLMPGEELEELLQEYLPEETGRRKFSLFKRNR